MAGEARAAQRRRIRVRREDVQAVQYRKRDGSDVLEDMVLGEWDRQHGRSGQRKRKSADRCGAIGLVLGACQEASAYRSTYCYYHHKLLQGLMEPSGHLYPVWPLPQSGYLIENEEGNYVEDVYDLRRRQGATE